MKPVYTLFVVLCLLLISCATVFAQSAGDYRSNAVSGTWNATANWQRYNGSAWVAASNPPTGSEFITIQSTDSMFINVAVSISGTLKNQGKLGGTGSLTIANGGTFEHAQNNGSLPVCTWATGSTCKVTGYVSGGKPNNSNQNFYNFTWDCAGQTATVDVAWFNNTIGGKVWAVNTGTGRLQMTSPGAGTPNTITINGDIEVNAGQFTSNGSSSSATITVNVNGNITVTGGNFALSRGSVPNVTWNLLGNFTVTNATLQNSGGTNVNKLSFAGTGAHNVTLTNVTYGGGTSYFTMEVQSGSTMNLGASVISSSNSGSFILLAGGTLATGDPGGIAGAIQCTGASNGGGNSFSTAANYTFNGLAAQVTSSLMPTTVNNLTISNAGGVTLSQSTTINGVLRLMAGVFDNSVPFTLGPSGSISYEGGSLRFPVSVASGETTIPVSFFVDQNYPNPFNPSTDIRLGLPHDSYVTAKVYNLLGQEVASLLAGHQTAGIHELHFNGSHLGSGVYIVRIQADNIVDMKRMVLLK